MNRMTSKHHLRLSQLAATAGLLLVLAAILLSTPASAEVLVNAVTYEAGGCCVAVHGNLYQTFVVPREGKLKRIEVKARSSGTYSFYVRISLFAGSRPAGPVLASAQSSSFYTPNPGWRGVDFSTPVDVTANQRLTFSFDCDYCGFARGGSYHDGGSGRYSYGSYYPNEDINFRVFYTYPECANHVYTKDNTCVFATICPAGSYVVRPATGTVDRICEECRGGKYTDEQNLSDCKEPDPCPSDAYETEAPTLTSNRECEKLSECDEDFEYISKPATATSDLECSLHSRCKSTEFEAKEPTATTDRECILVRECTNEEFETVAPTHTSNRVCEPLTVCQKGEEQSTPPTKTSDRKCIECEPGFYANEKGMTACKPCTTCGPGTFEAEECALDQDRVCTICSTCQEGFHLVGGCEADEDTACEKCLTQDDCGDGYYITGECDKNSFDGPECKACAETCRRCTDDGLSSCTACYSDRVLDTSGECVSSCGPGRFVKNSTCADCAEDCLECADETTCLVCIDHPDPDQPPATNEKYTWQGQCTAECPTGTWADRPAGACRQCRSCAPGTFVLSECSEFQDTVCEPCILFETYQDQEHQPTCLNVTRCDVGQEAAKLPTRSSDRICKACDPGEFQNEADEEQCLSHRQCTADEYETHAPTDTSDRLCAPLTVCNETQFEFSAPTATSDRLCDDITICPPGYETESEPTATSDRQCSPCESEFYNPEEGQAACLPTTKCTPEQYEVLAPTATSDRVCRNLTVCSGQFWELIPPTPTSDRNCSDEVQFCAIIQPEKRCGRCNRGFWLKSATECALCPPGHRCVNGFTPTACEAGEFQPQEGQTTCLSCKNGTAQALPGSPSCDACAGASLQPDKGQSECLPMPSGHYGVSLDDDRPEEGFVASQPCNAGSYCADGIIRPCPAGTFSTELAAECEPCGADAYQPVEQSTECFDIPPGFFGTNGNSSETSISVEICPPGSYCVGGLRTLCERGTWQNEQGRQQCKPCGIGRFTSEEGRVEPCEAIQQGYYGVGSDPSRFIDEEPCPVGHACPDFIKTPCGVDEYQPAMMRTSCRSCNLTCATGLSIVETDGRQCDMVSGSTVCEDLTSPTLTLFPPSVVILEAGVENYTEPGYAAEDAVSDQVMVNVTGHVDARMVGTYELHYVAFDESGNESPKRIRTIEVEDTTAPIITLLGREEKRIVQGDEYVDAGATVFDAGDLNIAARLIVSGLPVDTSGAGSKTVAFSVTDASGNSAATVTRRVVILDLATEQQAMDVAVETYRIELERLTSLREDKTASRRRDASSPHPDDVAAATSAAYQAYVEAGGKLYREDFEVQLAAEADKSGSGGSGETLPMSTIIAIAVGVAICLALVIAVIVVASRSKTQTKIHGMELENDTFPTMENPLFGSSTQGPPPLNDPHYYSYVKATRPDDIEYEAMGISAGPSRTPSGHRARAGSMTKYGFEQGDLRAGRGGSGSRPRLGSSTQYGFDGVLTKPVKTGGTPDDKNSGSATLSNGYIEPVRLDDDNYVAELREDLGRSAVDGEGYAVPTAAERGQSHSNGHDGPLLVTMYEEAGRADATGDSSYLTPARPTDSTYEITQPSSSGSSSGDLGKKKSYSHLVPEDDLFFQVQAESPQWFRSELGRNDARIMLEGRAKGSFVVRKSSQAGAFAISVAVAEGKLWHGLIKKGDDNTYTINNTPHTFSSIAALVRMAMEPSGAQTLGIPTSLALPSAMDSAV